MTATQAIRTLVPTYFYLSVDYTDGLTGQAARDSYRGVVLDVTYGQTPVLGGIPQQKIRFNSGDFSHDMQDANITAANIMAGSGVEDVPFYGSSSVDSYEFDAFMADDATLAFTDELDATVAVTKQLEAAWNTVPAAKLQWALASLIASTAYSSDRVDSSLKVLAELLGEQDEIAAHKAALDALEVQS